MTHLATLRLDGETEIRATAVTDMTGEIYVVLKTRFLMGGSREWTACEDDVGIPVDKFTEFTFAVREALSRLERDARPEPVRH